MLRQLRGVIAAVVVAATAVTLPVAAARSGAGSTGSAEPTIGPLQCGTASYVHGTFVWTDYGYDDHGPNTSAGGQGGATYPDASDQSNAADLVQLQAALISHGRLQFRAVLETLTHADEPLLGIGLDTDGNTDTGAAWLPGGEWHNKGALGLDALITASSDGGLLQRWSGRGWVKAGRLPSRVDTADNTITTSVLLAALHAGDRIRAVAALGLRRSSASWLTGNGPIYDLAFVHAEDPTSSGGALASAEQVWATKQGHATGGEWQDRRQADVLAGNVPAGNAVQTLDLAAMRRHATSLPSLTTPGYHVMLYRSHVVLPEGIVDGTAAGGLWAGPYQTYLVEQPAHPRRGSPMLVWLHGGGQNHLDNGTFAPQGPMQIGDAVAVFPYGRETTTANDHGYNGVSEQDALDVVRDAQRLFGTDPLRTVIGGVSTGGGGASRLAQLHPDWFSGVLIMSAYDDTHLPENLINMPVVLQNGGADPAASQAVLALTLRELDGFGDIDYRSYSIAAHSHADPVAPLTQCLLDRMLQRDVVADPARVVLAMDPANDPSPAPPGLDLRHDRSYWISGVQIRPGTAGSGWHTPAGDPPGYGDNAVARVDATTLAVAARTITSHTVDEVGQNVTSAATLCGPDSSTRTNDVWRLHGVAVGPGAPATTRNGMAIDLRNIAQASFDLARMRLTTGRNLSVSVNDDGPVTLRLIGTWPAGRRPVVVDNGVTVPVAAPRNGVLSIVLRLGGVHGITVTP